MAHFYEIEKDRGFLREDLSTPFQARREAKNTGKDIVASVTEKLKVYPDPFFETWRTKKAIELSKAHPSYDETKIMDMMWGMRVHPKTGEEVSSSSWGTECHKHLETTICGGQCPPSWEPFVMPFIEWADDQELEVVEVEGVISNSDREFNTAGTIDLLAIHKGKLALFDYKTREVAEHQDITRKAYYKDAMQLASEARMVKIASYLDYDPAIHTVIINTNNGDTHIKKWTEQAQANALEDACSCFMFYDLVNKMR